MNMLLRLCVLCVLEARAGDDEGAVEVVIGKATGETVLSANLLISGKWCVPALSALFDQSYIRYFGISKEPFAFLLFSRWRSFCEAAKNR